MNELTGALFGAGYFAEFHAEGWRGLPGARITAVADPAPGRARAFADRWGIPNAYEDPRVLLERERPAFVDVVTRPELHLAGVTIAAEHGAHVICQKPLAPSWVECMAVVEACDRRGVRLIAHENWRWQPWYRAARRLIDEGRIGRPYYVAFRMRTGDGRGPQPYQRQPYFRDMPRLLVHETLIHFLDTFRYLAGELREVFCRTARLNPAIAGEDLALIQLGFTSGAAGLIDANRIAGPNPPGPTFGTLRIEGDEGTLELADDGRLFWNRHGEPAQEHAFARPDGYMGGSVRAFQEHALASLRAGTPAESEGAAYLPSVAATFACYRSAETGRAVPLSELLPPERP